MSRQNAKLAIVCVAAVFGLIGGLGVLAKQPIMIACGFGTASVCMSIGGKS
jgi:hypothetical protein